MAMVRRRTDYGVSRGFRPTPRQAAQSAALAAIGRIGYGFGRQVVQSYRNYQRPVPVVNVKPPTKAGRKKLYKQAKKKILKSKVNALTKKVKADQAYHTRKTRAFDRLVCAVDSVNHADFGQFQTSSIESDIANLRYYDPATPGTLVTANAATGTYSRDVHISSTYHKLNLCNNYEVPCRVTVYYCGVKEDTSQNMGTVYAAGITDQVVTSADQTEPLIFPFELDMVKSLWRQIKTKTRILQPGQEMTCTYSTGSFDYEPAVVDTHNLNFQRNYRGFQWFVRVEGVTGHDSAVTTEQGTLQAGVDACAERIVRITYDAGVNLNDISFNDQAAGFTNGGVISNKPANDNQSFSL